MRVDFGDEETPNKYARRASSRSATCFEAAMGHDVCISFCSNTIHLLEMESLISLLRRVIREGMRAQRLLVLVASRVVLLAVAKG